MLLHFPDWGSLLVRLKDHGGEPATWDFSLFRDLKPIRPGAVASWRPMTPEERKKFERMHNRYLLAAGGAHVGPEQVQLACTRDLPPASSGPASNASNWK